MPDEFQQIKGVLGHQIARLHLEKVRGYSVIDEELTVEGVDPRARLDLVVRRDGEGYSPVEVKFQRYSVKRYGVAFEHVLNELGNGRKVCALDRGGNRLSLTRPILYLWFPPARKIVERPFYSMAEVIVFEDVLRDLRNSLGDSFIEMIGERVRGQIERFFSIENCALSERQRRHLEELFPR